MKTKLKLEYGILLSFFMVCLLAYVLVTFVFRPRPHQLEQIQNNQFTSAQMIAVNKDTLNNLLSKAYAKNVIITDDKTYKVDIQNQGSKIADFYNDNNNLMDIRNFGFSLEKTKDNIIHASFTKENLDGTEYVWMPTDILYGINK